MNILKDGQPSAPSLEAPVGTTTVSEETKPATPEAGSVSNPVKVDTEPKYLTLQERREQKRAELREKIQAHIEKDDTKTNVASNPGAPIQEPQGDSGEGPSLTDEPSPDDSVPNPDPNAEREDPNAPSPEMLTQAFAKLSRRDKELQIKSQELKAKEAELAEVQRLVSLAKEDPEQFLEAQGWDYDKLTRHKLSSPAKEAAPKLDPEIQKIKENQERIEQDIEAQKQQKLDNAIREVKNNIYSNINEQAEKYEICKAYGGEAVEIVYNVLDNYYNEHKEILPIDEAIKVTEDYLFENRVKPVMSAKKLQSSLPSKPAETSEGEPNEQRQQANQSQTLTNEMSATPPSGETRRLSLEERRERVKQMLVWK